MSKLKVTDTWQQNNGCLVTSNYITTKKITTLNHILWIKNYVQFTILLSICKMNKIVIRMLLWCMYNVVNKKLETELQTNEELNFVEVLMCIITPI